MAHKIRLQGPWSWLPETAFEEKSSESKASEPSAPQSSNPVRIKMPAALDALPAGTGILLRNFQWPPENPAIPVRIVIESPKVDVEDLQINDQSVRLHEINETLQGEIPSLQPTNTLLVRYSAGFAAEPADPSKENQGSEVRELVWKELRLELED